MKKNNNKNIYQNLNYLSKMHLKAFDKLIVNLPYEKKGILYSEMFFLYLLCLNTTPQRVIESGRARGQSTLILSKIFPKSEIISIEYDSKSQDVDIAKKRLAHCKNISLLFGDAYILLPKILSGGNNDIVLIDGPKGYKAIRLAIKALKYKNARKIFIHDTSHDTRERHFLNNHLPDTLYSDTHSIAKLNYKLDHHRKIEISSRYRYKINKPYGYSLACIQNISSKKYQHLIPLSRIVQFYERLEEKLARIFNLRFFGTD